MVNNAGINVEAMQPVTIHEISEDLFDQTFAINTKGVFLGMKYATAQMMEAGSPPHWRPELDSAYCAFKAVVLGLTRNVTLDYAKHRIHCDAIALGFTKTPMFSAAARLVSPEYLGMVDALLPLRGMNGRTKRHCPCGPVPRQ
ncbi:uncharacterized protein N7511_002568 [Penicillium nucicola]|uniref:uncharacterized protein n=1 Tax=Penicillium nucicola TaxID=1850975 RepID=UPI00254591BF|nr:uncharacterized protein N7511_002568 [Penicillium nucicola]KAJ5770517.1 hypothetical protein N7511_002568 [Penicillium nucicola]